MFFRAWRETCAHADYTVNPMDVHGLSKFTSPLGAWQGRNNQLKNNASTCFKTKQNHPNLLLFQPPEPHLQNNIIASRGPPGAPGNSRKAQDGPKTRQERLKPASRAKSRPGAVSERPWRPPGTNHFRKLDGLSQPLFLPPRGLPKRSARRTKLTPGASPEHGKEDKQMLGQCPNHE